MSSPKPRPKSLTPLSSSGGKSSASKSTSSPTRTSVGSGTLSSKPSLASSASASPNSPSLSVKSLSTSTSATSTHAKLGATSSSFASTKGEKTTTSTAKGEKDGAASGSSETKQSFRKKLPPRLILGDEKDESFCTRFSPDSQYVVTGGGDGGIRVYNTSSGKLNYHLFADDNLPVTCLRFRPNTQYTTTKNIMIAANADGTLRHWHVTTGKCVHTITEDGNQIYAVDYRPDAERFATAGKDFKIRIYDETKRTLSSTLSGGTGDATAGHASRVFSLKYNPTDSNVIISGGWDNTVQIWDTRMDHAVRSIFGPHVCGDSVDITNNIVLSGSWRGENALQLWDYGTGRLIETIDWRPALGEEPCLLYTAQFSKGNSAEYIAAGGSGSNEAKIFHRRTKHIVGEIFGLKKGVYSIDWSQDSKMLVVGGSGFLQLYELHLGE